MLDSVPQLPPPWNRDNIIPDRVVLGFNEENAESIERYQPGDEVWVKDWKKEPLQPVWTGHHAIFLAIPTAVKIIGITPWIHHTTVKKAAASYNEDTWKAVLDPQNPLKVCFQKQWPSPVKDAEPCSSHSGS